jgi:hypothetical protein
VSGLVVLTFEYGGTPPHTLSRWGDYLAAITRVVVPPAQRSSDICSRLDDRAGDSPLVFMTFGARGHPRIKSNWRS